MYRGFKLNSFDLIDQKYRSDMIAAGEKMFQNDKAVCSESLKLFMASDNSLDGSEIVNKWFPQINADVFISHSHKDEEMAKMLAGLLYNTHGITAFIDSCIWGYGNDLLRLIDKKYCLNDDKQTYDYEIRNYSTAHVHMMLSNALSMMIDKTECLIFLNTPNSIKPTASIVKTESPWLYYEIAITQIIRKNIPERVLNESTKTFSKERRIQKALEIEYEVDLNHLNELKIDHLNTWISAKGIYSPGDALDNLYQISPEKKNSTSLHG